MSIYVQVGRLDNNKRIEALEGTTVLNALTLGGYPKAENEVIQDIEGNEYSGAEAVEGGKGYFLIQTVKSGEDSFDEE